MNMKGNVKKTLLIVVLIAIFLSIHSCEDDNTVDTNGDNGRPKKCKDVIMPLAVGNYWTYFVDDGYGKLDTLVWEITRQIPITFQEETLLASARTHRLNDSSRAPNEWLFSNGPDGLLILGGISENDTLVIKNLEHKYPAEVGDSWSVSDVRYGGSFKIVDTLLYSLIAKDEEFQTPAGNFSCYVYKHSRRPAEDVVEYWDYYEYYSPSIGPVGITIKGQSDGRILENRVLLSYSVK